MEAHENSPAEPPVMVALRRLWASGPTRVFLNAVRLDEHHPRDVAAWRRVARQLRPEDRVLWMTYWHADQAYFDRAAAFYAGLPVPLDHIWVLGNTPAETEAARRAGFRSAWVNHNAWLDETRFTPGSAAKDFRAVLVCQLAPYKRVHLAARVRGLALVPASQFHLHQRVDLAGFASAQLFEQLPSEDVPGVLHRSRTGLILSAEEGACYASSEYLLCGLPVVSTPSRGGRDVFYTPENALLVEPTEDAVARGVADLIERAPDPWAIHRAHVALGQQFRDRFVRDVLGVVFRECGCPDDPARVLQAVYKNKMMDYCQEAEAQALVR